MSDTNHKQLTHAPGDGPSLWEQRVQHIEDMMLAHPPLWFGRRSHRELAKLWGYTSTSVVEKMAVEASRNIRRSRGSKEEIQQRLALKLEFIGDDALKGDRKNHTAAVMAVDKQAELLGAKPSQHAEVPQNWEEMSLHEKWTTIDRAKARIAALEAKLPPRPVEMPSNELVSAGDEP